MRIVAAVGELEPASLRAVIINCGTKWVTTLALLSTLRHASCPVLVIDCESKDGSRAHFAQLARSHGLRFDWLSWPLRPHPVALDVLLRELQDEHVLLVDSDAEIRSEDLVAGMRRALDADASAYGAGFTHGPSWMGGGHGIASNRGYYAERMWIPCVMLRVTAVREALARGVTFANRRVYPRERGRAVSARIRSLAYAVRWRRLRGARVLTSMAPQPEWPGSEPPLFVAYDTGADLHFALKAMGYRLAAPAHGSWGDVRHFHGVTRARLISRWRWLARWLKRTGLNDTPEQSVVGDVRERLANAYGVTHSTD